MLFCNQTKQNKQTLLLTYNSIVCVYQLKHLVSYYLGLKKNKPLKHLLNRTLNLPAPPACALLTLTVQPFETGSNNADQNFNPHK